MVAVVLVEDAGPLTLSLPPSLTTHPRQDGVADICRRGRHACNACRHKGEGRDTDNVIVQLGSLALSLLMQEANTAAASDHAQCVVMAPDRPIGDNI